MRLDRTLIYGGLLALTTVSTVACAHAASSASAVSHKPLRALDLQLSDLPAGYTQKVGRYWTNAQRARADHMSRRTYEQQGRLLSYEAEFEGDSLVGLLYLDVTLIAYKDQGAAHRMFAENARSLQRSKGALSGLRPVSVGALGSEGEGFTLTKTIQGFSTTVDAVVFRRGAYVVTAMGDGISGSFSLSSLTRLLQRVDQRITGASGS